MVLLLFFLFLLLTDFLLRYDASSKTPFQFPLSTVGLALDGIGTAHKFCDGDTEEARIAGGATLASLLQLLESRTSSRSLGDVVPRSITDGNGHGLLALNGHGIGLAIEMESRRRGLVGLVIILPTLLGTVDVVRLE